MDNSIKNEDSQKHARERLLDAAEKLFCAHGFDGVGVREIAGAADCNIASVNYYFGGKDNLYLEVWRRRLLVMRNIRLESIDKVMAQNEGKPLLEDLLRSYANAFIEPLVGESKGTQFIKLMAREMIDRHLPRDMFLKEMIIPVMTALRQALVKICPGLPESKTQLAILSVVGQLIHTVCAKLEWADNPDIPELDLAEAVNHIVKFSAAGIQAIVKEADK